MSKNVSKGMDWYWRLVSKYVADKSNPFGFVCGTLFFLSIFTGMEKRQLAKGRVQPCGGAGFSGDRFFIPVVL